MDAGQRPTVCSLQVMNLNYSEAWAINFGIPRNLFRYFYCSREIERSLAKRMLAKKEASFKEKYYQLPLLRMAVDFVRSEEDRADGQKLLCVHATDFLRERIADGEAAISKAKREGLPVEDWRGAASKAETLKAEEVSRQRYPANDRVKAKVWAKRSGLQYPCSLCGVDTCLAAVELVSDNSLPAGEDGESLLAVDQRFDARAHLGTAGLLGDRRHAALPVRRAPKRRAAERVGEQAASGLLGGVGRGPAAQAGGSRRVQGGDVDKEASGADQVAHEEELFRNVLCPECYIDESWKGAWEVKQLIVFPDLAVADSYVRKPDSGRAVCTCREQGLGLKAEEMEEMEKQWMADRPEGNLFLSDCLHEEGSAAKGTGGMGTKRGSGRKASASEPSGVKILSLDSKGAFKLGQKRLDPESSRAFCRDSAPIARRRAQELGLVPHALCGFMFYRGKVEGLDQVLQAARTRASARVRSGVPVEAIFLVAQSPSVLL